MIIEKPMNSYAFLFAITNPSTVCCLFAAVVGDAVDVAAAVAVAIAGVADDADVSVAVTVCLRVTYF